MANISSSNPAALPLLQYLVGGLLMAIAVIALLSFSVPTHAYSHRYQRPISVECAQGIEGLRHYLHAQQINVEIEVARLADQWLVWGQFYSSAQQFQQLIQQIDQQASGLAFMALDEEQFWLLQIEGCLFWLMVEPQAGNEWRVRFSLPLLPKEVARVPEPISLREQSQVLTDVFYQQLPLVHQYIELESEYYLAIFQWQTEAINWWQKQWQEEWGIAPNEVQYCVQTRFCTVSFRQRLVTLLWNQYDSIDYLLVTEQPCERCHVDRQQ